MTHIDLYTDGACKGNPGEGGWAAIVIQKNNPTRFVNGYDSYTTNNRMELTAVIEGLKYCIDKATSVKITSDSKYVIDGITKYIESWRKRNFAKVKNPELWKELDSLLSNFKSLEWQWVRGHNGHFENELADEWANKAIADKTGGIL